MMRQITDHVYVFPFYASFLNVYLVETPQGLLLVDTGVSTSQIQGVAQDLEKIGRRIEDIQHVFITHAHNDHVGGLTALLKRLPISARVYAHRRETNIIRGEAPVIMARPQDLRGINRLIRGLVPDQRISPNRVDVEIKDSDLIGGMMRVVELPGHAYGQCGLWWEEKRLLIGGDVMMHLPWGLVKPLVAVTPDMPTAIESIRKASGMKVEILGLGHGAPIIGKAHEKIEAFAAKL